MKKAFLCTILITFLSACAPKVTTGVLMPAETEVFSDYRNIAVLPFNGNYGEAITPSAENTLVSASVNGEKYFRVHDRQMLDKIIQEQKLQVSGAADDTTAVRLGRIIGVQAILTGTAEQNISSGYYTEKRSVCSATDKKGKCTAYSEYTVNCISKSAEVVFMPRLTDVSTGRVVYTDRLNSKADDRKCADSGSAVLSDAELIKNAELVVLSRFRLKVAPYEALVSIKLLDLKEGINQSHGKDMLKSSISFAEAGRMDRACEMWKEGADKYPDSVSFRYNLGLCSELNGDYVSAMQHYKQADSLLKKPGKTVNEALERIKKRMAEKKMLEKQL